MSRQKQSTPAGLLLAEDVLGRLRDLVRDTDLWEDSSINTNEMLGPGTSFANLKLKKDKNKRWASDNFLDKHWQAATRKADAKPSCFVAQNPEPQYLKIRTYSRLDFLRALTAWANALDGLNVDMHEDRSWTWDHQNPTSTGDARYLHAYTLGIHLAAPAPFNAKKWLKTAGQYVCHQVDDRADRCIFQLAKEAGVPDNTMHSVEYNREGFVIECETTPGAESIRDKLFSDCKVRLTPAMRHEVAKLQVALP